MALAVLSALLFLAAAPPYDLWPLGWVALIPLLVSISAQSPRQAALQGALTGAAITFLGFRWCLELMDQFSNLGPAAYLVMALMSAYQCIPWALWCGLLRLPRRDGKIWSGPTSLFFAALSFVALEYFYPVVFPWYLANTQHSRPEIVSPVELGGISLLSLLLVLCNLLLADALVTRRGDLSPTVWPLPWRPHRGRSMVAVGLLLALPWAGHAALRSRVEQALRSSPKLTVGVVQPNEWITPHPPLEGLHAYQRMTERLARESQAEGQPLDLVLWPESAVRTPPTTVERQIDSAASPVLVPPGLLRRYPLDVSRILPSFTAPAESLEQEAGAAPQDVLAVQRGHSVPILFGTTLEDLSPEARGPIPGRAPLYNCGVLIDGSGTVLGVAKKVKLLIFGENIPGSAMFPSIYRLLPSASALLPGTEAEIITFGQARLGMMICYEDLLPWFHYELAQKSPHILLNLTNDAWFGRSAEPACHLALSTLRAVEGRCYLIRSTPTGISAVIDPWGQVVASIPSDQAGTLRQEVALLELTTLFERWGNWVAWLCLGLALAVGGYGWLGRAEPS